MGKKKRENKERMGSGTGGRTHQQQHMKKMMLVSEEGVARGRVPSTTTPHEKDDVCVCVYEGVGGTRVESNEICTRRI